jgi:hypothetical protein
MNERTIICPRCDARVTVTADKYFFTVLRDATNHPKEMRVIEDGKIRHACPMSLEALQP